MRNSPFTVSKDYSPSIRPEQFEKLKARIAAHLREYRQYRRRANLPRIKSAPDWSGFETQLEGGPVFFYPVIRDTPTIGGRAMDMHWNASIETWTPGGRWHPPESDERILCTAPDLIQAAFCARALIQHEALMREIGDDQLCKLHSLSP
jgi:hypothetical protein